MRRSLIRIIATVLLCSSMVALPLIAYSEEVNIGVVMPMTGKVAAVGIDTLHGAQIAAKEINDDGGINVGGKNYKIVIRDYDDEASPAKAVAGMQMLKDRYNIPALLDGLSGPTMACLEKNERLGILIMGFFKAPAATTQGNKLVLRTVPTTEGDAQRYAYGAAKILKVKTYALISDASDWGKAAVRGYEDAFKKLGVKEVAREWFDERSQTDFRSQLTKIKAAKPDVIVLTGHDESSAGIVKQAHELAIKQRFLLSPGFQITAEKLTGPKLIEGYVKGSEFTSKTPWPPANARYRTKLYPAMGFSQDSAAYGLQAYANIHILARAMQKAGTTTDALKIRQAVPSVVPLPEKYDTTGLTAFLENGDCVIQGEMGVFRNGKLIPEK